MVMSFNPPVFELTPIAVDECQNVTLAAPVT